MSATPETAAYLRGVVDGTVVVTAAQMDALKAAAKREHEEVPGADVLRAFCVCGHHSMGSARPLCALIRRLQEHAELQS